MTLPFYDLINTQIILIDLINLIALINILINVAPDSLGPRVNLTYTFTIL